MTSADWLIKDCYNISGLVGMFVGALYCENNDPLDWHRAKVLSLKMSSPSNASVVVSFVDYGTIDEVGLDDIRLLPKAFAQYPCQAIRMDLGVIKPPDEPWAPQACLRFKVDQFSISEATHHSFYFLKKVPKLLPDLAIDDHQQWRRFRGTSGVRRRPEWQQVHRPSRNVQ